MKDTNLFFNEFFDVSGPYRVETFYPRSSIDDVADFFSVNEFGSTGTYVIVRTRLRVRELSQMLRTKE